MANCRRQKNALYFIRSQQIIIRIFRRAALKKIARNFHGAQFLIKKLFGHSFRRVSHSFRRAQWWRFLILRAIKPIPRLGPQNIPTRAEYRSRRPRQSGNENSAPEGARARTRTRSRAKRIQRRAPCPQTWAAHGSLKPVEYLKSAEYSETSTPAKISARKSCGAPMRIPRNPTHVNVRQPRLAARRLTRAKPQPKTRF